ncbi:glycosyltransferase family 9 protein [bacterium]|nr:glycosyltransferase family 9 protein [bacterium]
MNTPGESSCHSVLCMCLSGVGDALMFTPFIDALKAARPATAIDVLVMFRSCESLYASNPNVRSVFHIDFVNQNKLKSLGQVLSIRRRGYDSVVVAFPANRWEYNAIQALLGGRRVGHRYLHHDRANLNFLKHDWVREDDALHNVDKNLQLLEFFGVARPDKPPALHFHITDSDHAAAERWLAGRIARPSVMIGFHPGSALFKNHIEKRWPKEKYAALARQLVDELDAHILVFGDPSELELQEFIRMTAGREGRVHAVTGTTLRESAALVQRSTLMVSNDSALMHVSAAVGTPVVGIFAYTNWRGLYPWGVRHRVIRRDLPCSPCFFYSPKPAQCHVDLDYTCTRGIEVDTVYDAVLSLLAEIQSSSTT